MISDKKLKRDLTALTRDLMLIRSTETHPLERERCFQFIENHLEAIPGVRIDQHESNGFSSLVAMPKEVTVPELLLCGHIDVIEHSDVDRYLGTVKDGRIYGPGSGDMKGADAIMIELFRHFQAARPGVPIGIALTSDEERGGENGVRYLFEEAGLSCKRAIIPDGGSLNRITVEEKGIIHLRIRRIGQPGHAARPWLSDNALQGLIDRLAVLHAHFKPLQPTNPTDTWHPTCTLTMVSTPNETVNRVPGEAEALLDIRFPPPDTVSSVLAKIGELLGPEIELHPVVCAEPTHLAPDPLFCEITEAITGEPTELSRVSGGSDARFICKDGTPVMLSRPLVGNLHAADEWIELDSMVTYFRICESYIQKIT